MANISLSAKGRCFSSIPDIGKHPQLTSLNLRQ